MLEKHTKFKAYWESIGKPSLEFLNNKGNWVIVDFGDPAFDGVDYRIKDDPHWELRRDWVESGYKLPIEYYAGNNQWRSTEGEPTWDDDVQYRKAQPTNKDNTMTEQNPHAALIDEFCQDWKVNSKPWTKWEYDRDDGHGWIKCDEHPMFIPHFKYRRKPQTISINGFNVPMPITVKPEIGQVYYVPNLTADNFYYQREWINCQYDNILFDRNICHLDQQTAMLHAKALLSFMDAL